MKWDRTVASEWGCIVSGIIAFCTAVVWAFKGLALGWFQVLSIVAALACSALYYLGKRLSSTYPMAVPIETAKPTQTDPSSDQMLETLKQLVEDDAKNIHKRVREINQRKEFHYDSGPDPHIDIITELWNGSVFQFVNYGEIAGHVKYAGKQLAGEPRIIVSVEPPLLSLAHGDSVTLVVRQYLSGQVADMMEANRNRGVVIDFESVFVSFKILPLGSVTKMNTFKWQGPAKFAIEDTTRV